MYPWPFLEDPILLDQSLRIAMDYLEMTGQVEDYEGVQKHVAKAILVAYRAGVRHRIRLGNIGIRAVEHVEPVGQVLKLHPRVS